MDPSYFATVPRGMESLLAGELKNLGALRVRQSRAGVAFGGPLETAYRACLWSRLASRVLLPLMTGPAADADQLYATTQRVRWDRHLDVAGTLAVDFTGSNDELRDTRFGAMRVKDAIVDQFRAGHGDRRPNVDARAPDLRVNAHLVRDRLTLSLDLSGDSLHRRGYRTDRIQVEAPLKENLAAAVLLFAGWPKEAAAGGSLVDPLCGSGTLPIEAAWMAADIAPGLLRAETPAGFGFGRWNGHDRDLWQRLVEEARERRRVGLGRLREAGPGAVIRGSDHDPRALPVAEKCVARAGMSGYVTIETAELATLEPPAAKGLLASNAPYGARIGDRDDTEGVYRLLGERLRAGFGGWRAVVLAGHPRQAKAVGIEPRRSTTFFNGALECTAAFYEVADAPAAAPRDARAAARSSRANREAAAAPAAEPATVPATTTATPDAPAPAAAASAAARPGGILSGRADQFANRLHKNFKRMGRQLRREGITCYRLYDADLPDYNLVVDVYGDWVHVQEYAPPAEIDPAKVRRRLDDALAVIGSVIDAAPGHVVLKERRRQRGAAQYERQAGEGAFLTVIEDDLSYLVNLRDYLDTGLFLDQRLTRRLVRKLAGGRRFLNLFAYTGTMTVDALAGGSPASTTVDLSATYLEWAQRNLKANGFSATLELSGPGGGGQGSAGAQSATDAHSGPGAGGKAATPGGGPGGRAAGTDGPAANRLVQADCLRWVAEAEGQYDLVWLDPPTFSNSKRMGRATFDVQRDHADLIKMTARRLLAPGGILLFATNRRGFKLDHRDLGGLQVKDLSRATLPFDCVRGANRHHVFRLERPVRAPVAGE